MNSAVGSPWAHRLEIEEEEEVRIKFTIPERAGHLQPLPVRFYFLVVSLKCCVVVFNFSFLRVSCVLYCSKSLKRSR